MASAFRWSINMSTQNTRDQSSPRACKRCGGVLHDDVDVCPYCGANHPFDSVHSRIVPGPLGPMAAGPPAPAAAKLSPASVPAPVPETVKPQYQDGPLEHEAPSRLSPRWIFTKGLLIAGIFLTIAYAAHLLFVEVRKPSSADDEQITHTSGGSIAHDAAGQQASVRPTVADTGSQPATTKPQVMPPTTDMSDNPRAQQLDSALRIAEQCASEHVWGCVQQKASEALAIDSGSKQARALMERAIVATGWTPLSSPNPPGALNRAAQPAVAAPPLPSTMNAPANQAAPPHAASPASNGNSVDAQERAIVEGGWKQPSPGNAGH
ncbi:hypothetical protein [Paraburkholderia caffeinitolerans]|nr:hypothetical protein [Paraburkholderia caffeinitolerans]